MNHQVFSPRTTTILIVIGGLSLIAGFVGAIFWDKPPAASSSHRDSYSLSALGHRAFVDLLEMAGYPVLRSRSESEAKAGTAALLILIEPRAHPEDIATMLDSVQSALVVLPKWSGDPDPEHPAWLKDVGLVHKGDVDEVLQGLGITATLVRDRPGNLLHASFSEPPLVALPQQSVESSELTSLISADGRVVLGSVNGNPTHWVLTDPDILANHGIARNAKLVLEIIDQLLPEGRAIIIDETLHGHEIEANVWRELGRFPLVLVLIAAFSMLAFWIWSGMRRFGSPLPSDNQLTDGKNVLIENTAQLLMFGGHSGSVLKRYYDHVVVSAASFYRLSPELTRNERISRLNALSNSSIDLETLRQEVRTAAHRTGGYEHHVLHTAQQIRQWREETVHGTR